jgi:C1A family cysteine protease
MIKPIGQFANRIIFIMCIVVIVILVAGIGVPASADTNVTGSVATIPTPVQSNHVPTRLFHAPENPRFTEFLNRSKIEPAARKTVPVVLRTGSTAYESLEGIVPSPLDLSHTTGQHIGPDNNIKIVGSSTTVGSSYPATYDLRALGRSSPVKDQGTANDCWAFASLESLESYFLPGEVWDFSENNMKNLLSGAYPDGFDSSLDGEGNGEMATAYLVRWSGPVNESDDPYNDASDISPTNLSPVVHVQNVYYLPPRASFTDNDNIKYALTNRGEVMASIYYNWSDAGIYTYYDGVDPYANHAITLVGWDDSYSAANFTPTPPGNGAFIAKNSWGTYWGDEGYFYISYYDPTIGDAFGDDCFVFTGEPVSDYNREYSYDPLGWTDQMGFGTTNASFANVFTSNSTETLTAVGFYATSTNTAYTVRVYLNPPANGPINATGYAVETSGTLSSTGYHTVTVPGVALLTGQNFSVVISATTPGYDYPIPVEDLISGYSTPPPASTGEGYISPDGITWSDITTMKADTNVCVKVYTSFVKPAVIAVVPTAGPVVGGTSVNITGTGFYGGVSSSAVTSVKFGSTAATAYTVNSDTSITATAPSHAVGTVNVTVTTPFGTSATSTADQYTYTAIPAVTGISPAIGPVTGGTSVNITGTGFTVATNVTFGTRPATSFTVVNDTSITATSPAGTAGTVDVTVTTAGGTSATSTADQYTYTAIPAVTGISPAIGPVAGGTSVTITGTMFYAGGSSSAVTLVKFGSTAATAYTVNSNTSITATAPSHAAGTVNVTITTSDGTSAISVADKYIYAVVAAPTITKVSPNTGPLGGGTSVTITGTNLLGATQVYFGGIPAISYVVNGATQITATNPGDGAGTIDVIVAAINGTSATSSADQFAYEGLPTVTGVSPSSGPVAGGTSVTITGTNLLGATQVYFGGSPATSYTVTSATSITTKSPVEQSGPVDAVTIITPSGTSAIVPADQFTYTGSTQSSVAVTRSMPATVVPGANIIVTLTPGTTFATSPGWGVTETLPTGWTFVSTTADSQSDVGGAYQFAELSATPITYTVTAPSTPGAATFNGTYIDGNKDTGTIVGTVLVTVKPNPLQTYDTNHDGYIEKSEAVAALTDYLFNNTLSKADCVTVITAYLFDMPCPPTVSLVSPTSGPTSGGTSVTIVGYGFTGATQVYFGGIPATSYIINNSTSITATSPAGSVGTVDVTVTTPGGISVMVTTDQFTYI